MTTELWYLFLSSIVLAVLWIPYIIGVVKFEGQLAPEDYTNLRETEKSPVWVKAPTALTSIWWSSLVHLQVLSWLPTPQRFQRSQRRQRRQCFFGQGLCTHSSCSLVLRGSVRERSHSRWRFSH